MNKPLIEAIGVPAMLEQTAEECCELGKACLKLARIMRGENKAYISESEAYANLVEEIADVKLCLENLIGPYSDIDKGSAVADEDYVQLMYTRKIERMINRLHEQE